MTVWVLLVMLHGQPEAEVFHTKERCEFWMQWALKRELKASCEQASIKE